MKERISREELIKIYNVELAFFDALETHGLLCVEVEDNVKYVCYEDLPAFERLANWHYDLEVNIPGLEIIRQLLLKIEKLREENRMLSRQQTLLPDDWEDF